MTVQADIMVAPVNTLATRIVGGSQSMHLLIGIQVWDTDMVITQDTGSFASHKAAMNAVVTAMYRATPSISKSRTRPAQKKLRNKNLRIRQARLHPKWN